MSEAFDCLLNRGTVTLRVLEAIIDQAREKSDWWRVNNLQPLADYLEEVLEKGPPLKETRTRGMAQNPPAPELLPLRGVETEPVLPFVEAMREGIKSLARPLNEHAHRPRGVVAASAFQRWWEHHGEGPVGRRRVADWKVLKDVARAAWSEAASRKSSGLEPEPRRGWLRRLLRGASLVLLLGAAPLCAQVTSSGTPNPPANHLIFIGDGDMARLGWDILFYPKLKGMMRPQDSLFFIGYPTTVPLLVCGTPFRFAAWAPGLELRWSIPNNVVFIGFAFTVKHFNRPVGLSCPALRSTNELTVVVQA